MKHRLDLVITTHFLRFSPRPNSRLAVAIASNVVLVLIENAIEPQTEQGPRQLELASSEVRRLDGHAAIDQARSRLASDALAANFDELMWIDGHMGFTVEDVRRLQSHDLPLVGGAYSQKKAARCGIEIYVDTTPRI